MAIKGTGREYDITFNASSALRTTTSQYRVVGVGGTTTNADSTVYLANGGSALNNTTTARWAIGINQTYMSSTADNCAVRLFGVSKAVCAASVGSGDFVTASIADTSTANSGRITPYTPGTVLTSTAGNVVIGRALETGSTGTVISVFVNPAVVPIA